MSYMIRYRVNTDSVNTTLLLGILSGNKIDFKILRICEISFKKKNLFFLKKNLSISKEILSPSFFFFRSSSQLRRDFERIGSQLDKTSGGGGILPDGKRTPSVVNRIKRPPANNSSTPASIDFSYTRFEQPIHVRVSHSQTVHMHHVSCKRQLFVSSTRELRN